MSSMVQLPTPGYQTPHGGQQQKQTVDAYGDHDSVGSVNAEILQQNVICRYCTDTTGLVMSILFFIHERISCVWMVWNSNI